MNSLSVELWSLISDYNKDSVIFKLSKSITKYILNYINKSSINIQKYIGNIQNKYQYNISNNLLHGYFHTIYKNCTFKSYFYNNLLNGYCEYITYDKDYQKYIIKKGCWIDGKPHGLIKEYYLNNKIISEKRYDMGIPEGYYNIYSYNIYGHKMLMSCGYHIHNRCIPYNSIKYNMGNKVVSNTNF